MFIVKNKVNNIFGKEADEVHNLSAESKNLSCSLLPVSVYFGGMRPAVVDIETLGLSPARDRIYLIGVMSEEASGELTVTQFFSSSEEDEPELLMAFSEFIKDFDILLNYNGSSFDIPYINKRCERLGLHHWINPVKSLDYLRLFRESYVKDMLPDLKLKTVERLAGVQREDSFDGKECIRLYKQFERTGDKTAGRQVLLHNFEDLSCFPALNSLLEKIDLHKALGKTGFLMKAENMIFFINKIALSRGILKIEGSIDGLDREAEIYDNLFSFTAGGTKAEFVLSAETAFLGEFLSELHLPGEGAELLSEETTQADINIVAMKLLEKASALL